MLEISSTFCIWFSMFGSSSISSFSNSLESMRRFLCAVENTPLFWWKKIYLVYTIYPIYCLLARNSGILDIVSFSFTSSIYISFHILSYSNCLWLSVRLQPSSNNLFSESFPLPNSHGRRDSQLGTMPECEIRMLRKAALRTWRPLWPTKEGVPGLQQGQKAKPPSPWNQSFGAVVTSQSKIQLTGCYTLCDVKSAYTNWSCMER